GACLLVEADELAAKGDPDGARTRGDVAERNVRRNAEPPTGVDMEQAAVAGDPAALVVGRHSARIGNAPASGDAAARRQADNAGAATAPEQRVDRAGAVRHRERRSVGDAQDDPAHPGAK